MRVLDSTLWRHQRHWLSPPHQSARIQPVRLAVCRIRAKHRRTSIGHIRQSWSDAPGCPITSQPRLAACRRRRVLNHWSWRQTA